MRTNMRKTDAGTMTLLLRWCRLNLHTILLFGVLLLVIFLLIATLPLSHNDINSEKNAVFSADWQYSIDDGIKQEIALPYQENAEIHSHITLENQLPDVLAKGATVLVRTSQQDVEVFVAGEQIYTSFGMEGKSHLPSSAYHFVRLPTDGANQKITVVLSSPYQRYVGHMNQIYIGSKASNLFFLIHENGFRFAIGLFIFSVGLLMAVSFLFAKGQKGKNSLIYLGAFFACAGFWLTEESRMAQFILPYPVTVTNLSIFALTLLPVFLGLYYYCKHEEALRRYGKVTIAVVTAVSLGLAVCACVNPALPLHILPYYLVFMGIYMVAIFVALLAESIKAGRIFSVSVCGGLLFGVFGLLELIFYLGNIRNYNNSMLLTIGLLGFCVLMVADAVQNFAHLYREAIKVSALTVLAYTDSLTGLKNRTAFLGQMSELDAEGKQLITLAMFDVNNLKLVNDTLGHLVGDAMLRHCTKAMTASLRQEDELFRIGGDEFAAIIRHDKGLNLKLLEDRLETVMERENKKPLSYRVSIAYGYATYSRDIDKTFFETLARADKKMYTRKRIQKSKR